MSRRPYTQNKWSYIVIGILYIFLHFPSSQMKVATDLSWMGDWPIWFLRLTVALVRPSRASSTAVISWLSRLRALLLWKSPKKLTYTASCCWSSISATSMCPNQIAASFAQIHKVLHSLLMKWQFHFGWNKHKHVKWITNQLCKNTQSSPAFFDVLI